MTRSISILSQPTNILLLLCCYCTCWYCCCYWCWPQKPNFKNLVKIGSYCFGCPFFVVIAVTVCVYVVVKIKSVIFEMFLLLLIPKPTFKVWSKLVTAKISLILSFCGGGGWCRVISFCQTKLLLGQLDENWRSKFQICPGLEGKPECPKE